MKTLTTRSLKQILFHFLVALALLCSNSIVSALPAKNLPYPYNQLRHQDYSRVYQGDKSRSGGITRRLFLAGVQHSHSTSLQDPKTILDRLVQKNDVPNDVVKGISVEKGDSLNAATDGSSIIITQALLNKLNTNDERAFVISHELSHIVLNHISQTQIRRVGLSFLDNFLVRRFTRDGGLLQMASRLGVGLVDKRSSRTLEYQADDLGVRMMKNAGYNPKAAIQVFSILKAATPNNGTPEFLQSHPITDSRVRALAEKYKL